MGLSQGLTLYAPRPDLVFMAPGRAFLQTHFVL